MPGVRFTFSFVFTAFLHALAFPVMRKRIPRGKFMPTLPQKSAGSHAMCTFICDMETNRQGKKRVRRFQGPRG